MTPLLQGAQCLWTSSTTASDLIHVSYFISKGRYLGSLTANKIFGVHSHTVCLIFQPKRSFIAGLRH